MIITGCSAHFLDLSVSLLFPSILSILFLLSFPLSFSVFLFLSLSHLNSITVGLLDEYLVCPFTLEDVFLVYIKGFRRWQCLNFVYTFGLCCFWYIWREISILVMATLHLVKPTSKHVPLPTIPASKLWSTTLLLHEVSKCQTRLQHQHLHNKYHTLLTNTFIWIETNQNNVIIFKSYCKMKEVWLHKK